MTENREQSRSPYSLDTAATAMLSLPTKEEHAVAATAMLIGMLRRKKGVGTDGSEQTPRTILNKDAGISDTALVGVEKNISNLEEDEKTEEQTLQALNSVLTDTMKIFAETPSG